MKLLSMPGKWIWNMLVAIDQVGNTVLGGDPDETISSRLGRIKVGNGGRIPWTRPLAKATAAVLDVIDRNHVVENIEGDEGGRGIVDRPEPLFSPSARDCKGGAAGVFSGPCECGHNAAGGHLISHRCPPVLFRGGKNPPDVL